MSSSPCVMKWIATASLGMYKCTGYIFSKENPSIMWTAHAQIRAVRAICRDFPLHSWAWSEHRRPIKLSSHCRIKYKPWQVHLLTSMCLLTRRSAAREAKLSAIQANSTWFRRGLAPGAARIRGPSDQATLAARRPARTGAARTPFPAAMRPSSSGTRARLSRGFKRLGLQNMRYTVGTSMQWATYERDWTGALGSP